MKRILLILVAILAFNNIAYAKNSEEIVFYQKTVENQKRVDKVGFTLLNANGIEGRTVFDYNISSKKNAYTRLADRQIVIYKGLFYRLESDDELAAILAHEISHSVDSYNGIFRGFFSGMSYVFAPKKYEYKADKRAVDYMVNAGYNPVAFIVVMNKISPQRRYDFGSTHPLTSRRLMQVYEYIYLKYPEFLVNNKYKDNIFYQNFLLTSKENRAKFQKKIETNSKRQIKYL